MPRTARAAVAGYCYHVLNRGNNRAEVFLGTAAFINEPQTEAELDRLRHSVRRGAPFGNEEWTKSTASALGLESSLRPPGRPRRTQSRPAFDADPGLFAE